MKIPLTQRHIANGVPNPNGCPTALAIKEHFGEGTQVTIGIHVLITYPDSSFKIYAKTPAFQRFISDFDDQNEVPAGTLNLGSRILDFTPSPTGESRA